MDTPGPDHRAGGAPVILTRAVRLWLYGVTVAVFALLLLYDVVGEHEVGPWLELAAVLLGIGTPAVAAANITKK